MINKQFYKILILITILTAVGQFANTIYVPAMGEMANHFALSNETIQNLMVAYLLPYGFSQFFYGPISDTIGRRPTILTGLTLYLFGSILTVLPHSDFTLLITGCFFQGLGAGVAGVMARTVMKDCYTGRELYQANTIMSLTMVVAPLLAPILGSVLTTLFGWQSNFIFLLVFCALTFTAQWQCFRETHTPQPQNTRAVTFAISAYKHCLQHQTFMLYAACLALTFGCVAVFEASANNLFGHLLHYSPQSVGLLFILPMTPYILGSYMAKKFSNTLSLPQMLTIALLFMILGAVSLTVPAFEQILNLKVIILPIMLTMFGAGILFPTATTGAMDPMGKIAGTAGAMLGGLQNLGAALMTYGFTLISQTTQRPLAIVLILATAIITILVFIIYRVATNTNLTAAEESQKHSTKLTKTH